MRSAGRSRRQTARRKFSGCGVVQAQRRPLLVIRRSVFTRCGLCALAVRRSRQQKHRAGA
eukprot:1386561-Pleurochrysis_carterae.AAC.1